MSNFLITVNRGTEAATQLDGDNPGRHQLLGDLLGLGIAGDGQGGDLDFRGFDEGSVLCWIRLGGDEDERGLESHLVTPVMGRPS